MSDEIVWLKAFTPLPISTLSELIDVAPKKTYIRVGECVELDGELRQVLEFVTAKEFLVNEEEVQK